jgi:hypothetical protein
MIYKYGLKKYHLVKFNKKVDLFYRDVIVKVEQSDLIRFYQKRFKRYHDSLFTFLNLDNIPWNNNMAERALRHIAVQRKISGHFFEKTTNQYLLLLSIMQSCRFQNKSFLNFLMSGEKNVLQFKSYRPIKSSVIVGK